MSYFDPPKPAKAPSDFLSEGDNGGDQFQYQIPEGYEAKAPTVKKSAPVVALDLHRLLERKKSMAHVEELEVRLGLLKDTSWESIDKLMTAIARKHGVSPKKLHGDFKEKNGMIPDAWISKQKETIKEEVQTPMQLLADRVASVTKPAIESTSAEMMETLMEQKVFQLEKQIYDMRKMILEVTQANVSRLGSMETIGGSGEVRFERLDDVDVNTANDGDTLIYDATLQRWIPASAGGVGDLAELQRQIGRLEQKVVSVDDKVEGIVVENSLGLALEDGNDTDFVDPPTFIDDAPGGVSTFVVGVDNRGIFTLDGIAQPSIQIYRGDNVDFDLSGLGDGSDFQIVIDGVTTSTGSVNRTGSNVIVDTGTINAGITKFYYQSASDTSNGWIVAIIDP